MVAQNIVISNCRCAVALKFIETEEGATPTSPDLSATIAKAISEGMDKITGKIVEAIRAPRVETVERKFTRGENGMVDGTVETKTSV